MTVSVFQAQTGRGGTLRLACRQFRSALKSLEGFVYIICSNFGFPELSYWSSNSEKIICLPVQGIWQTTGFYRMARIKELSAVSTGYDLLHQTRYHLNNKWPRMKQSLVFMTIGYVFRMWDQTRMTYFQSSGTVVKSTGFRIKAIWTEITDLHLLAVWLSNLLSSSRPPFLLL